MEKRKKYAKKYGLRRGKRHKGLPRKLGMQYQYSYEEQWQPKDLLVTFRMYQLNFDEQKDRVYQKYWNESLVHFIEKDMEKEMC